MTVLSAAERTDTVTVTDRYGVTERPFGPWVKLYADVVDRKAHYTDRQFRTLIEVLSMAVRLHGFLPSRQALVAREGQEEVDFLFSEGDLEELPDGSGVVVHRWKSYQADSTNADRQRRFRNGKAALQTVTNTFAPSSRSTSSSIEIPLRGNDGEELTLDDPVVTYFDLTTRYPKGNALAWVKRLGDVYGFEPSSAAMTSAWAESDEIGTLLSRTEDRLVASERTAELREKAEEKERLRQKRATRRAIVDPGPEKVGAIMGDIRKALGR